MESSSLTKSMFDFDVPSREQELMQGRSRCSAAEESATFYDHWFAEPHTHLLRATKVQRKSKATKCRVSASKGGGDSNAESSLKTLLKAHNQAASRKFLQSKQKAKESTPLEKTNASTANTKADNVQHNTSNPNSTRPKKRTRLSDEKENNESLALVHPAKVKRPSSSGSTRASSEKMLNNDDRMKRTHSDEYTRRKSRPGKTIKEQDIEALLQVRFDNLPCAVPLFKMRPIFITSFAGSQ